MSPVRVRAVRAVSYTHLTLPTTDAKKKKKARQHTAAASVGQ
ncbi:hypothetical protein [Frigoribacterium faeni]|nr:hypothetical protein [Frigoribacterium faeni]